MLVSFIVKIFKRRDYTFIYSMDEFKGKYYF